MTTRYTFDSLGLPTPKKGDDLVGRVFLDPDEGYEVTIRRTSYFSRPHGAGWVLDTDSGSYPVYLWVDEAAQ